jgi:hypothetical protein
MNQSIKTIGEKSIINLDGFVIEIEGKNIAVFERTTFGKNLIFEKGKQVKA